MFINSGDVFAFPFALDFLYSKIKEYDIVYGPYFEKYNDYYKYIKFDENTLNSKMFSKKFILDNNIGFSDININISYSFNYLLNVNKAKKYFLDRELLITKNRNIIKMPNEVYQIDYFDKYIDDVLYIINKDINKKNQYIISLEALFYAYLNYLYSKRITRKKDLRFIIDIYQNNKYKDDTNIKKNCITNDYLMNLLIDCKVTFEAFLTMIKDEVVL